ncbi:MULTISPECIES: HU family DNA-binding protein [unclassified Sphingobium]|uniref:HU family DNA-binding protein n=1 Tax=unclassified Sphingobium TaxID=2611147 RepID=UPI001E293F61|nr:MULTISPECIES: HU family DNA-binding protein [unclassified Sphingobium]GLJ00024.1 DNA-binding protein [Sphingobium sp. BS19]CAH0348254.1 DNA-binding protein HU 1 [Sphingobium sp. CECT 9361]
MTGNDLIDTIAAAQDKSRAEVKAIVDALFATIGNAAAKGDEIAITGFGKFTTHKTPARGGRHPRTGEPMTIKAAMRTAFKPAKALKDQING